MGTGEGKLQKVNQGEGIQLTAPPNYRLLRADAGTTMEEQQNARSIFPPLRPPQHLVAGLR